jgi:hypothetical protein
MEKEQSWRNFNLPGETYLNLDTFSSSSPNTDSPPDLLYSFLSPWWMDRINRERNVPKKIV